MKPFLKWAGGKRWLVDRPDFQLPDYTGRYIEPFLGSGAVFFSHKPASAVLSDANLRLVETYLAIKNDHKKVESLLAWYHSKHSKDFYYSERMRKRRTVHTRAAQFLYLNRTCWNGLYRENLRGEFNVPIGTKTNVILDEDDFAESSKLLKQAHILHADFEEAIRVAQSGDLIFADPPYTTAHNLNGFVKYNQTIFSWNDQLRLARCVKAAIERGVRVVLTNASHQSIKDLYCELGSPIHLDRASVISGDAGFRGRVSELLYVF